MGGRMGVGGGLGGGEDRCRVGLGGVVGGLWSGERAGVWRARWRRRRGRDILRSHLDCTNFPPSLSSRLRPICIRNPPPSSSSSSVVERSSFPHSPLCEFLFSSILHPPSRQAIVLPFFSLIGDRLWVKTIPIDSFPVISDGGTYAHGPVEEGGIGFLRRESGVRLWGVQLDARAAT
ncbi:hypothetical protein ACJRO7_026917 [Eucalyptus globulus]|uniref:Uncharacterized protein n=1 Tax=Eucalyptus globulus TaxID=34317 RepID=A0ABD3JPS7_EUCGL